MKNFIFSFLCIVALSTVSFAQQKELTDADITNPPEVYSRATIESWVKEAAQKIRPTLPVYLMGTAEWSNYVNYHHFVPAGSDPHAGGVAHEIIDFNWDEGTYASKGLPTAEVTETGQFNFWWNRCNFKKYDETKCKWLINLVIQHEARHHDQWQQIALQALNSSKVTLKSSDGKNPKLPQILEDLKPYPAALNQFLSVWTDVAHYQCREVAVYSMQILIGEMPNDFLDERIPYMKWYTDKCLASKWNLEFAQDIKRSNEIQTWWANRPQATQPH